MGCYSRQENSAPDPRNGHYGVFTQKGPSSYWISSDFTRSSFPAMNCWCKIWILVIIKLFTQFFTRKKGKYYPERRKISQICHLSLDVEDWRRPVQKAKIPNSEVGERNNFSFDEDVGAGNQLQQDACRPGIKKHTRMYKDNMDILQYYSYCSQANTTNFRWGVIRTWAHYYLFIKQLVITF